MIYQLSNRYQKEIALSMLSVFFISGIGEVNAQLVNNGNQQSGQYVYSSAGKKNAGSFETADAKTIQPFDLPTLTGDDEKEKNRKTREQKSTRQNFSGKHSRTFNKADIGGPSQPEMTGFKSVGSDNMVSPFTGDFSYNVPLLDVGGYPINMFYNSGISMDQEASWLGLGWNINPGTITRNMRGLPDDFNGSDNITKTQSFRDDKTFGLSIGGNIKLAGFPLSIGANLGLAWNNKLGVSADAGVNAALSISAKSGTTKTYNLTLGAGLNGSSRSGAGYSPSITLQREVNKGLSGTSSASIGVGYNYSSRMGLSSMHLDMNASKTVTKIYNEGTDDQYSKTGTNSFASSSGTLSFAYPSVVPSITKPFTRQNYSLELSMGGELYSVNLHGKIKGYYSRTFLADDDKITNHPAYGMMYLQGANDNKDALLDFNRANDGVYTPNNPTIAMPVYTYDVFSINGEGTGGSFRAYRGDVGHMRDATVKTRENAFGLGVDLGFGNMVHVGADLNYVYTPTQTGDWVTNNMASPAFSFQQSNKDYQAVYFKNPSEKTVPDAGFQTAMSGDDLVRFKMSNTASANPMLLSKLIRYDATKNLLGEKTISAGDTKKSNRDKRTQVISFLNAEESERIGMNSRLYSYNAQGSFENKTIFSANCIKTGIDSFYRNHDVNHAPGPQYLGGETDPFRHKHHISEIDVLGNDGKKYVYGLPVYNKKQYNITFSIAASQKLSDTKAIYDADDNTTSNSKGRDWIMEKEEIPAYTHSYLLTELTSPNYVDMTGNGITEDDMGDAVKFNYSKYNDYKWRTPVGGNTASYSSGLKTDEKDDKAHYVYGEREQWYLYSVESKNMVARFYVKSDRKDGRPVTDENGILDMDASKGMKRLDKIQLFSKGDLIKYGDNAKPIKTIRFFQSYKLCKNTPASNELGSNIETGQGKLTLDSIWISYNGNTRKPKSKYVFYYPESTNNPNYSFEQSDRWGTFKPKTDNPDINLSNEDYPYSTQDQVKANKNAAAWAMNKILLPSGGIITVDYESDSYAYVQSKKAASMCQILGFGTSQTSLPATGELPKLYANGGAENDKVYIQLPYAISATGAAGKAEFASRYLEDVKQLYLKLAVTMPTGSGLSGIAGEETIPVYADIADYGLINSTTAWVRTADIGTGHTPMVQAALQFLTKQLPGKAYKGYDLSDNGGFKAIVMAMGGMVNSVGAMFNGEINTLKNDLKCQQVVLYKCFAKLTSPTRNKLGGGHRVKRIVISDNWDKMTGQMRATYGKEYRYTTTELVNGKLETISSGVASWEPSIGGDENPNRDIMRFVDHNKGGPYDYGTVEMPLGEMFYPSAMVGYSRVEILSIHRDTVKNQPTRQVSEFYTNKDFPYKSTCTDLKGDANAKYEPAKIMQLLRIDMMKGIAQSQGFLVETNDMNGKEKSNATYTVNDPVNPVSYTQYFYNTKQVTDKSYSFNHTFPVISGADGKVTNALIGKDVEVMTDFREHRSETITANLSINFDGFIVGFFPIPLTNLLQPVVREGTTYRSAAILKLVTHYGIMDSIVVVDKGSMVSTKNLVYDAETGNPLLTRTQNEHNKSMYNFSYPAHWAYSGMGLAYKNIDAVYEKLTFRHGILENPPAGIFDVLESGDEIYVDVRNASLLPEQLPCDGALNKNNPWDTLRTTQNTFKIWAVNMQKVGAVNPEWVFMDANGNPFNAAPGPDGRGASIRIIRSGKRNMLDQSVAAITSMSNPIVNGQLVFNDATNIIQTTAASFKDNWRVDNSFYRVTETQENRQYARVKRADIFPEDFVNVTLNKEYRRDGSGYNVVQGQSAAKNTSFTIGKFLSSTKSGTRIYVKDERRTIFVLYNYGDFVPAGSNVYNALLGLHSHTNLPLFQSPPYPNATHSGLHTQNLAANAGSTRYSMSITERLGFINSLKKDWYSNPSNNNPNPQPWIDNYFDNSAANLSSGVGIIPYAGNSGFDNYYLGNPDSRLNVTLPLITGSGVLANQRKLGLKLKLDVGDDYFYNNILYPEYKYWYRCFWSPSAEGPCYNTASKNNSANAAACRFASPNLSYYYYNWGDTLRQYEYPNDPTVNKMLTKYISTVTATYCKSKFDRKAMNPYVEGVLGNWRVDSTYAYYGERKESDFTTPQIDTRIAGAIKNYKTFWSFAGSPPNTNIPVYLSRNQSASDVWVWNSAITQYNRKGYEIENTDPLGRFNSGLYGYNQQLPVAIANNARVREILFDGFEDYDYQTAANCISCQPHRAFNYTTAVTTQTDATQHHTGRYSLKVNANQNIKIQAPVIPLSEANRAYGLKLQNKTNAYINQGLAAGGTYGTGLKASWYNHAVTGQYNLPLEPAPSATYPQAALIYTQSAVYPEGVSAQQLGSMGVATEYFSVKWEGKIQAPATGTYYFKTPVLDNGYRLRINGNTITQGVQWTSGINNQQMISNGFSMVVGQVYTIEVSFYNQWGPQGFQLQWKIPNSNSFGKIPIGHLYMPTASAFRQVDTVQYPCYRLDSSQVTGNALTDSFSLIQGRKMLLSAWVKVGTANCCYPVTYDNGSNSISIGWDQGQWVSNVFKPSGAIIEGWQRYEGVFDVQPNVPSVTITLNNTGSSPVFFDDVRIQPYNSNMKSYVYHSSNLRLMAELDENNYSSLYEYDDDGSLTRVKKETQLGIKTITETRSATQKKVNEQ